MSTPAKLARRLRGPALFMFTFLAIEFLDEFVFGAREAAWPLIRQDLNLDYVQIGLLFSVPTLFASVVEPILGILGDVWQRRIIVLGGGVVFAIGLLGMAGSSSFAIMMLASLVLFPASGAFVSLSQSTLMDIDTSRHEHNMARWGVAGSLGVVVGSLGLGVSVALGTGWRAVLLAGVILTVVLVLILSRQKFPRVQPDTEDGEEEPLNFKTGVRNAISALRRPEVLRWLVLLQFSDLMLDILYGYLALYFVDVVGVSDAQAAIAVSVWTVVGLIGDFLLIPLLEKVRGLSYLRVSALIELILFPAFLLVPNIALKLIIIGALGFFNSGWYSVLKGQQYSSMPGQSGTVLAIDNVSGLIGSLIPLAIGLLAERFGLGVAMWALVLGPLALLIGLPRRNPSA